jgi:hypothetical protein
LTAIKTVLKKKSFSAVKVTGYQQLLKIPAESNGVPSTDQ